MTEFLTARIFAKNLLAQVNEEGHRQILLNQIIDHRQDVNYIGKVRRIYRTYKWDEAREDNYNRLEAMHSMERWIH